MYMEFRDFSILDNDRELININRIRVYYNLFEILSGNALNYIKEVRIFKSEFSFNYEEEKELIELFTKYGKGKKTDLNLPDLKISGRNLKIKLSKGTEYIQLSRLFFDLDHQNEQFYFDIRGTVKTTFDQLEPFNGSSKFHFSGTISDHLDFFNTRIVLKSIETGSVSINKLSLQASYKDGIFDLIKVEDARPLDLRLSYSTVDRQLSGKFASENFVPLDYFIPKEIDSSIIQWLGTSVTGVAEFNYLLDKADFTYTADIEALTNNSLLPVQAALILSLTGDSESIDFSKLKVVTRDGAIFFHGNVKYENFLPSGDLHLSYNLFNTKIIADMDISREGNSLIVSGSNITINAVKILKFSSEIDFFKNDIDFQVSFNLDPAKDLSSIHDDIVLIDGNIQYKPDFFLNLAVNTVNMPVNALAGIIPSQIESYLKVIPGLSLDSELFISTDFEQYSFSASQIEISSEKGDKINLTAFGNNESFEINNISANWNDKYLDGLIKANMTDRSMIIDLDFIYEELPYALNINYYPDKGIFLDGSYNFSGSLFRLGNALEFRLSIFDLPIPSGVNITEISFDIEGYFNNPKNWKASVNSFTITNIPGLAGENTLNLNGYISEEKVSLTAINYVDSLSSLTGSGDFNYYNSAVREFYGGFSIFSLDGEQYEGKINIHDKDITFTTSFNNAPLDRFNNIPLSGYLNGGLEFTGLLSEPDINMTLQLENGEFNSSPLEIETSIEFHENNLQLEYFRIDYMDQILQKGSGEYNLNTGKFLITTEYLGLFDEKHLTAAVEVKGNTVPFDTRMELSEIISNDYYLTLGFHNIFVDNAVSEQWSFEVERNNNIINFSGGPEDSIEGYMDDDGDLGVILKKGLPLRFEGKGSLKEDIIDFEMDNFEVDISLINLVNIGQFVEFTDGTAYGYLGISGQITDPDFNGVLHAREVNANVLMVPESIEPFDTSVVFKDKTMIIGPESLQISNNLVRIDFNATFSKWLPGIWVLNIDTEEEDKLHIIYSVSSIGLGIDGFVDGKLNIFSNEYGISINSDLNVNDCIISLGPSTPRLTHGSNAIFTDMKFTTGRKVQFLWPSNTLPILRATANTGQVLTLAMDNLSRTYSLNGEIGIKYGSIFYFQKSFYISEGSLIFNENEAKFDPLLDFRAQIREVDTEGEVVNISLILDKKPVSQFTPRFESDPPLSDIEIFSILGTGVFAQIGGEQIDLTSALLITSDLVAQFGLIQSFEKKVKDIFNLDLFSIRTQMIQNILIDRFVGSDTTSEEIYMNSFGSYLDNTSLYLGKYFGDDIFLQAVVQIGTQINLEDDQPDATNESFIESSVSFEWQSPLFLLGITVKPDFDDPLSSVQNTSLDLSWGYSY